MKWNILTGKEADNKVNKILQRIEYDEETCLITLDGKVIGDWNEDAPRDYPEDLTWDRYISGLFLQAFEAGYRFAKEEHKDNK